MKLLTATAALFLAATAALPASAAAPTGHSFYQHGGRTVGLHHDQGPYWRRTAGVYAAAPMPGVARPTVNGQHCAYGVASETYSAYPAWALCR